MTTARKPAIYALAVAGVLAVWIALTATGAVKPLLLASPLDTLASLGVLFQNPAKILGPIGITLAETATAFLLGVVIGVPLGIAVGFSPLLRRAYEPLFTTLNALPLVVLYPVLAATLGIASPSKVALGALYAFFPIIISTTRAAGTVDPQLITASEVMGATRPAVLRSVVLPAIAVPVISGMRVAVGLGLVTVIAAEFISGARGVGYELAAASQLLDTPTLFAWVVIACGLTVVVNVLFSLLTRALVKGIER